MHSYQGGSRAPPYYDMTVDTWRDSVPIPLKGPHQQPLVVRANACHALRYVIRRAIANHIWCYSCTHGRQSSVVSLFVQYAVLFNMHPYVTCWCSGFTHIRHSSVVGLFVQYAVFFNIRPICHLLGIQDLALYATIVYRLSTNMSPFPLSF